jgi:hypothetical protein
MMMFDEKYHLAKPFLYRSEEMPDDFKIPSYYVLDPHDLKEVMKEYSGCLRLGWQHPTEENVKVVDLYITTRDSYYHLFTRKPKDKYARVDGVPSGYYDLLYRFGDVTFRLGDELDEKELDVLLSYAVSFQSDVVREGDARFTRLYNEYNFEKIALDCAARGLVEKIPNRKRDPYCHDIKFIDTEAPSNIYDYDFIWGIGAFEAYPSSPESQHLIDLFISKPEPWRDCTRSGHAES